MTEQRTGARTSLREINVEARRQRILEAVRTLLADGGMEKLSMRNLAREAGLSVTTLYNLVGSRDEILKAVIDDSADRLEATFEAPKRVEDPLARIRRALVECVDSVIEDEEILRPVIVAQISGGWPTYDLGVSRPETIPHWTARKQTVLEGVEEAIDRGLLRDALPPDVLLGHIFFAFEHALLSWAFGRLDGAGFRVRALASLLITLLAVATSKTRSALETEVHELEREWRKTVPTPRKQQRRRGRSSSR